VLMPVGLCSCDNGTKGGPIWGCVGRFGVPDVRWDVRTGVNNRGSVVVAGNVLGEDGSKLEGY